MASNLEPSLSLRLNDSELVAALFSLRTGMMASLFTKFIVSYIDCVASSVQISLISLSVDMTDTTGDCSVFSTVVLSPSSIAVSFSALKISNS